MHFQSRTSFICETNRKEKSAVFDNFQSVLCTVNELLKAAFKILTHLQSKHQSHHI